MLSGQIRQKLPLILLSMLFGFSVHASDRITVSARFESGVGINVKIQVMQVGRRVLASTAVGVNRILRIYRSKNGSSHRLIKRVYGFSGRRFEVQDTPKSAGRYSYSAALGTRTRILTQASSRSIFVRRKDLGQPDSTTPTFPSPSTPTLSLPAGVSYCPATHASLALNRINYHRAQNGRGLLSTHGILAQAALQHAALMAQTQIFSHDGWFDELWNLGFRGPHMSQNIANYIRDPIEVIDALMTSYGHMLNMLYVADTHIGIACVIDQNGKYWWVFDQGS